MSHLVLLDELVDDGGGGDGLTRAGRALDEGQRALQHALDGGDLRVVELRQARGREAAREVRLDGLLLHLVAEQLVVQISTKGGVRVRDGEAGFEAVTEGVAALHAPETGVIDGEGLHGGLHAVEARALPHKVHGEAVRQVHRHAVVSAQLQRHCRA